MVGGARCGRVRWLSWRPWLAGVLAGLVLPVQATPDDDHRRGVLAFQRGDMGGAMTALRAPAQAGHAPSQSLLAHLMDRADFVDEARVLWQQAAAQGDAEAHAGLASLYLAGRGVAKDEKRALQHFSEAAALGHALAIELVATAWARGQLGADATTAPQLARAALTRAADRGHVESAEALALGYREGRYGLPVDPGQAEGWRARAQAWRTQRALAGPAATAAAARP